MFKGLMRENSGRRAAVFALLMDQTAADTAVQRSSSAALWEVVPAPRVTALEHASWSPRTPIAKSFQRCRATSPPVEATQIPVVSMA